MQQKNIDSKLVTFNQNKKEPFHSWYNYLEGYSPEFVKQIIHNYMSESKFILDPFSGTGSTGFGASESNKKSYYCEINPVLQFVTETKIDILSLDFDKRKKLSNEVSKINKKIRENIKNQEIDIELKNNYHKLFDDSEYFPEENFKNILKSKTYIDQLYSDDPLIGEIVQLAVISSLVNCSFLKRAGDLRHMSDEEVEDGIPKFIKTLKEKLDKFINDILKFSYYLDPKPKLICENAFNLKKIEPKLGIDGIITSPPYVNGTNYFRNTRLELWFLGCLKNKDDLKEYRKKSLTAGINSVNVQNKKEETVKDIEILVGKLEEDAYDNRIPKMVSSYFYEIQSIFKGIKNHLNNNSTIAIDIGDSQYAGIHVKTDELLIKALEKIGYNHIESVKLRNRYSNNGKSLKQVLIILESL